MDDDATLNEVRLAALDLLNATADSAQTVACYSDLATTPQPQSTALIAETRAYAKVMGRSPAWPRNDPPSQAPDTPRPAAYRRPPTFLTH